MLEESTLILDEMREIGFDKVEYSLRLLQGHSLRSRDVLNENDRRQVQEACYVLDEYIARCFWDYQLPEHVRKCNDY